MHLGSRRQFLQIAVLSTLGWALRTRAAAAQSLELREIKGLLKIASPYGYRVLIDHEMAATEFQMGAARVSVSKSDPAQWLKGKSWDEVISTCDTMVHETMHGLCTLLAYPRSPETISRRGSIIVRPEVGQDLLVLSSKTQTFPSKEMASSVLPELQKSDRFGVYITPNLPQLATQSYGIYGLLDEFNAYYAGCRVACDLLTHFLRQPGALGTGAAWVLHLASVSEMLVSHQEFRGYILSYMAYTELHHPDLYQEIVGAADFGKGFRALDAVFATLAKEFYTNLPSRIGNLQRHKIDIALSGSALSSGNQGRVCAKAKYLALAKAVSRSPALKAQADRLLT